MPAMIRRARKMARVKGKKARRNLGKTRRKARRSRY